MNVNQLPSIPILAIRKLRKRVKQLMTYAHVDTAVTLRRWCTLYGGHKKNCACRGPYITKTGEIKKVPRCNCGWVEVNKKLTTFSDEFYEKFRKKAS